MVKNQKVVYVMLAITMVLLLVAIFRQNDCKEESSPLMTSSQKKCVIMRDSNGGHGPTICGAPAEGNCIWVREESYGLAHKIKKICDGDKLEVRKRKKIFGIL